MRMMIWTRTKRDNVNKVTGIQIRCVVINYFTNKVFPIFFFWMNEWLDLSIGAKVHTKPNLVTLIRENIP